MAVYKSKIKLWTQLFNSIDSRAQGMLYTLIFEKPLKGSTVNEKTAFNGIRGDLLYWFTSCVK